MWRGIFTEQAVSDTITGTLDIDAAIERGNRVLAIMEELEQPEPDQPSE